MLTVVMGALGIVPKRLESNLKCNCLDTPMEVTQKKNPPWNSLNLKEADGTSRNAGLTLGYLRQLAVAWHLQRQHETQDQRPAC